MTPEEIIEKFSKLTMFTRGNNKWFIIDIYDQVWQITYTGNRTAPFEIILIKE